MRNIYILALGGILLLFSLLLFSCERNELDGKAQKVKYQYIVWACDCANWATPEDIDKYHEKGDALAERCVFMEPADTLRQLPDDLGTSAIVEFTGQFYKKKGFPKGYSSIEMPDKAKVFRYTKYRIIRQSTP